MDTFTVTLPVTVKNIKVNRMNPNGAQVWNSWTAVVDVASSTTLKLMGNNESQWVTPPAEPGEGEIRLTINGPSWITNDGAKIVVVDNATGLEYKVDLANMTVLVPDTVTSVTVNRLDPNDLNNIWNHWDNLTVDDTHILSFS